MIVNEYRAGAIIGGALAIMVNRFGAIFTIVLVASLPMIAASINDATKPSELEVEIEEPFWQSHRKSQSENWIQFGATLLSSTLSAGAVGHYVYHALRGRGASVGRSLGAMAWRLLLLLGVVVASTLLMMVGLILFIIPCFIFASMVYVSAPVCVVEGAGVFASMNRSTELTKDYRWRVFVAMAGVKLLMFLAALLLGAAVGLASGQATGALMTGVEIVVQLIQTAWNATAVALSYHHLRSLKESVGVADVATVFD